MLVIRREQMRALEAEQRRRFEDGLCTRLATAFAQHPALRPHVGAAVALALRHGIDDEADVTLFVELAVEYGTAFETLPWVAAVLSRADLAGPVKLRQLAAAAVFARH